MNSGTVSTTALGELAAKCGFHCGCSTGLPSRNRSRRIHTLGSTVSDCEFVSMHRFAMFATAGRYHGLTTALAGVSGYTSDHDWIAIDVRMTPGVFAFVVEGQLREVRRRCHRRDTDNVELRRVVGCELGREERGVAPLRVAEDRDLGVVLVLHELLGGAHALSSTARPSLSPTRYGCGPPLSLPRPG